MPVTKEQLDVLDPQSKQQAMEIIAELERRKGGTKTVDMANPATGTINRQMGGGGFLPKIANALSFSLRGKTMDTGDDMAEKINTLMATEAIKRKYEAEDPYKQSQIDLNKAMLENIKGGGAAGGDLVYRDPDTGMEIPQEQALADIGQGKQYIVKRRVATRQGVKEEPVSEPEKYNTESAGLVAFADTFETNLNKIKAILGKTPEEQVKYDWGPFGASRVFMGGKTGGMLTPTGSDNEKVQLALQQLKKAAFAEGGKQLTPMEAGIVFAALDPSGKSPELWMAQLDEANNIIKRKRSLVRGGKTQALPGGGDERNQAKQVLMDKGYSEQEAEQMLGQ